ncbi:MAG: hypothetical protein U9P49_13940 [Thermodesulfobacteriota bacterium]|nr:hypothetical protein [Thermodesulfobacteriota bacterium]
METIKRRNPDLKNKRIQAWLPIDLRKFLSGSRKTSNLTGIISLELNKYFDIPPVVRVFPIQDNIVERINDFSWVINPTPMIDWFPVKLLSAIIFSFLEIAFYRKKNPYFFSISNLGRFKLSDLSTEDFKADRIFGIPPFPLGCPLIALPANHDNGLELTCITNTDKDPFIEFIDQLEEEIYSLEKQLSSKAASD